MLEQGAINTNTGADTQPKAASVASMTVFPGFAVQWMRTGHTTCPVCKSGISRETVIPLYGRGGDGKGRSAGAAR